MHRSDQAPHPTLTSRQPHLHSLRPNTTLLAAVLCSLSLLIAACSSTTSSAPTTSSTTSATTVPTVSAQGPSLSDLERYIASSATIAQAPDLNTTIPPLSSLNSVDITLPMSHQCYSEGEAPLPSDPATACAWGDTTSAKTIYLFGDSQAATWLPAFNWIGKNLGYKVVMLAKAGCPPWEAATSANFAMSSGLRSATCRQDVATEIALANTLHPAVIFPVGDDGLLGANSYPTASDYEAQIATLQSALKPSGSPVVLLSSVPQYTTSSAAPMDPTTCLTVHSNNVIPCLVTPSDVSARALSQGLASASSSLNLPLVNVLPLFCTGSVCPLFVKGPKATYLVHFDSYHMNRTYSTWIAPAFQQLIMSHL